MLVGHDRGRGPPRQVEEPDGLGRGHVGDAVMVDDFQHVGVLDPLDRLPALVVVHEDDLALGRLGDIGTRDDPYGLAGLVKHDTFAKLACHELGGGVFDQLLLFEHQHVSGHEFGHLLR